MGMGYSSGYADTISIENLEKIAPVSMEKLKTMTTEDLKDSEDSLTLWSHIWCDDVYDFREIDTEAFLDTSNLVSDYDDVSMERAQEYHTVFDELRNEFTQATTEGEYSLELCMGYHEDENRYDEVTGGFFHVDGCYIVSPAARNFIKNIPGQPDVITRAFYTTLV